jgi:hypothetical protein
MRRLSHISTLTLVGLLLSASAFAVLHAYPSQGSSLNPRFKTTSLCDLTQHWKKYDHQVVRVLAIYREGPETAELYDPACPSRGDRTAWVYQEPYDSTAPSPVPQELQKQFALLLRNDGRVRTRVVGRFDGPKPVNVPPGTPPMVADFMRAINSRYGHMNHWDFQFTFLKIEAIDAVPSSETWPSWPPTSPQ